MRSIYLYSFVARFVFSLSLSHKIIHNGGIKRITAEVTTPTIIHAAALRTIQAVF
jgi:hypothetical protein